jgi:hypothetical protein
LPPWGGLAPGAHRRKHADLQAVLTEATTGIEPV